MVKMIGIGFLGAGVVGGGALEVLLGKREQLAAATGAELVVRKVLVRDPTRARTVSLPPGVLTTDPSQVLDDPSIQIVVELMGGEEPARTYIATALAAGKHVVTANKEVIAKHGAFLSRLATKHAVNLFYEASVGGGIPIVAALQRDLVANEIQSVEAIINGTTNFILTEMATGRDYTQALREAQRLGYAEADPRNDVEGIDAAYKLAILASLAFRTEVRPSDLVHVGITNLEPNDFRYAAEMGYVIKLVAWARQVGGAVEAAVYPTLIPESHQLASVRGVFNAILVEGDQVDKLMLYGRGAGAKPTASAVVADLCRVAHNVTLEVADRTPIGDRELKPRPFRDLAARFYFRMLVLDRPGVLAQIAQALGDHRVSIATVIQKETDETAGTAELVIMTHRATEHQVEEALRTIRGLEVVHDVPSFIRV